MEEMIESKTASPRQEIPSYRSALVRQFINGSEIARQMGVVPKTAYRWIEKWNLTPAIQTKYGHGHSHWYHRSEAEHKIKEWRSGSLKAELKANKLKALEKARQTLAANRALAAIERAHRNGSGYASSAAVRMTAARPEKRDETIEAQVADLQDAVRSMRAALSKQIEEQNKALLLLNERIAGDVSTLLKELNVKREG